MLSSLKLSQFRCFESLRLEISPGATAFIGANAQGKTSILEAVCVLLRLQSPRTTSWGELVRFESDGFGLAGMCDTHELEIVHQPRRRRKLFHQGEEVRKSREYLEQSGLVVWMGNDDLSLVTGSGARRRRYLDFLASQVLPGYTTELRAYDRALRARNHLLKSPGAPNWAHIEAYSQVLIAHGTLLQRLRRSLVDLLNPHLLRAQSAISNRHESLQLTYRPGASDAYAEELAAAREQDRRRGQTTFGPHRDDLLVTTNERPAAKYASEGQQRTIALALKLAQLDLLRATKERTPILLIDDVFGELDPGRRHALLQALPMDSQKLVTTTSTAWLPEHRELGATIYHVYQSRVSTTPT